MDYRTILKNAIKTKTFTLDLAVLAKELDYQPYLIAYPSPDPLYHVIVNGVKPKHLFAKHLLTCLKMGHFSVLKDLTKVTGYLNPVDVCTDEFVEWMMKYGSAQKLITLFGTAHVSIDTSTTFYQKDPIRFNFTIPKKCESFACFQDLKTKRVNLWEIDGVLEYFETTDYETVLSMCKSKEDPYGIILKCREAVGAGNLVQKYLKMGLTKNIYNKNEYVDLIPSLFDVCSEEDVLFAVKNKMHTVAIKLVELL